MYPVEGLDMRKHAGHDPTAAFTATSFSSSIYDLFAVRESMLTNGEVIHPRAYTKDPISHGWHLFENDVATPVEDLHALVVS